MEDRADRADRADLDCAFSGVDVTTPNAARMYDYLLGGKDNFAADRAAADRAIALLPNLRYGARMNRAFLARAVRHVVGVGVTQILDIGSGLPTAENTHDIAQRVNPRARVVYVDNDPVVVSHARCLLQGTRLVRIVSGDLRLPAGIIGDHDVQSLLDFSRPVALILAASLHFLADEDANNAMDVLREAIAPGSFVLFTHSTNDDEPEGMAGMEQVYERASVPLYSRSRGQCLELLDGLTLLPPGLVYSPVWRAETPPTNPERSLVYVAVARKSS